MENLKYYKIKNIEKKYSSTWYDWLINYIPEPLRKSVNDFKDEVIILFKKYTTKQTVYGRGKKLSKPKTQKHKFFYTKKRKKRKKDRLINDRIVRDIWTSFEITEEKKERKTLEKKKILMID